MLLTINMSLDDHDRLQSGGEYVSENGDGVFTASVRTYCQQHDLHHGARFVSLAASIGAQSAYLTGYGEVVAFLRPERVLIGPAVAAPDDFRDIAVNSRGGAINLNGSLPERVSQVQEVAMAASKYAEVRIFRSLTKDDIERFDTSGSLAANLRDIGASSE